MKLPSPAADATEEALMQSLGMAKNKKGEYETFDRFLLRTEVWLQKFGLEIELATQNHFIVLKLVFGALFKYVQGIISLMANIMASHPPEHVLMGGHKGAVDWLTRFLGMLPEPPQSPLPLLTAPVLDAFLVGAGHMLANRHTEAFKKQLDVIMTDIVDRLDDGPIGQPSLTRLKKTLKDGFEGFKNNLPHKALAELYNGAGSGAGPVGAITSSGFGSKMTGQATSSSNPFGNPSGSAQKVGGGSANNNPFGPSSSATGGTGGFGSQQGFGSPAPAAPFGGSSNPFGASGPSQGSSMSNQAGGNGGSSMQGDPTAQPSATPFGATASNANPASFSSQSNTAGAGSAFGNNSGMPGSTPFGGSTMNSDSGDANPSPFSAFGSSNASSTPFDSAGPSPAPAPFGSPAPASGGGFNAFGASSSLPAFGAAPSTQASPFGGAAAPGSSSSNPFGSQQQPPFGGGSQQTPFGGASQQQAPFGGGAQQPFGGASQQQTPFGGGAQQQTPFGGGAQQQTPFRGGAQQQTPFGGGAQQQTPFGGGAQQQTPFGGGNAAQGNSDNKKPCKFFAQGTCRSGSSCRFSHGGGNQGGGFGGGGSQQQASFGGNANQRNSDGKGPCRFFAQGNCRNGNNCPFTHAGGGNQGGGFGGGFR